MRFSLYFGRTLFKNVYYSTKEKQLANPQKSEKRVFANNFKFSNVKMWRLAFIAECENAETVSPKKKLKSGELKVIDSCG